MKKCKEIQKSKQDLLEKLIEEQKTVIAKIEAKKGAMKAEEKAGLMALLKSLGASIEAAKENVKKAMVTNNAGAAAMPAPVLRRSHSEVRKTKAKTPMKITSEEPSFS